MKPKVKLVRQIYLDGKLYSKPEKAARMYVAIQCNNWWQVYLQKNRVTPLLHQNYHTWRSSSTHHIDIAILHERQVRMMRRVLPIFKRMLQTE